MPALTIVHTPREGTLVLGTTRGDGSAAVLKQRAYGPTRSVKFNWSGNLGCWHLPHSRDTQASPSIQTLAERLREIGFTVTIIEDDDATPPFGEAEQKRARKATQRAERFGRYSKRAEENAEQLYEKAHSEAQTYPLGQPVLVDHSGAQADINRRKRIVATFRKSFAERERGEGWKRRSDAAAGWESGRNDPATTLRRVQKLEADERHWLRRLSGREPITDRDRRTAERQLAATREQLDHWRALLTEAEREGFKRWCKDDFTAGDFVLCGSVWYEVLRVNAKTLRVPSAAHATDDVVTRQTGITSGMKGTLPYDKVIGRRSPQEMAAAQEQPPAED